MEANGLVSPEFSSSRSTSDPVNLTCASSRMIRGGLQCARYSVGDGLQHSLDFVGYLALLLFEIGFKLGQSSVVSKQDKLPSSVEPDFRARLDGGQMYSGHLEACVDERLEMESLLRIEILHDVVGTSGYHCGVLRSFPVERIEQGIG
ncbi:hypothetical protein Tco_0496361 [Tanacetum coccineum]